MLVTKKIFVKSGETAPVSGYYIYLRNADMKTLPCHPTDAEKAIVLAEGQKAPYITSCNNHAALYQIVATKSSQT
ncbi:MAG: hypothetical protein D9C04_05495 [Nitrosopumilus sp. B06]|nr:MAG: hypothetical protein EB828_05720 [Nitrosopumilus sp. D6]RNJ79269.1 MAG: hypothetical protein D9C04_05495 [Nitrosopumilus sp. B06]